VGILRKVGHHRYYDPGLTTWGLETLVGNTAATHDEFGDICADSLGNVHCVVVMDSGGGGPVSGTKLRYKRWDFTNGWGPEVVISDIPQANFSGIANSRIVSIACEETTGTTRVVFRDLANGGGLVMSELPLNGSAFTLVATLGLPNTGAHTYYAPTLRGTLNPVSNNTGCDWDVTWQYRASSGTPPYELWFDRITCAPGKSISLTGLPLINTNVGILIASPADPFKPYICALSFGDTPGIPLLWPDTRVVPLNWDFLFSYSLGSNSLIINNIGSLDGSGLGQATLFIPNSTLLINFTIYTAFVVVDPLAQSGITSISQALPITFQ
jgi:hypothetical protein